MRPPAYFLTVAAVLLVAVPFAAGATQHVAVAASATTDQPTNLAATSVTLNGHTTLGCAGSRGFKLAYPDHTAQISSSAGSGSSSVSSNVTGLSPGTAYAYYAYATDCASTATGNPLSFTTLARLTLTMNGSGKVTGGLSCTASCAADVKSGQAISLTATPSAGSRFASWGGICAGQGQTCTANPTGTAALSVTFIAVHTITVTRAGDGTGTVTSTGGDISCGSTCTSLITSGSSVTLNAAAAADSIFSGWSGGCSGTNTACTVSLASDQAVTATFVKQRKLSIGVRGRGAVASAPGGLACSATCSAGFAPGTGVALTATAQPGWRFSGWGGACSGRSPICSVTLSADATVTADFSPLFVLRVIRVGGQGVVRSAPNGILCGDFCTKAFLQGAVVALRAKPARGFRFVGWGGDCRGAKPTCTVTMRRARDVVALYAKA
jgi:Divergent InlB B-repeat domain